MPIKQAAFKHLRQTKKRTVRNAAVKQELKNFTKAVRKAIYAKDKGKLQEYKQKLQKVIDKASQKKVIKPENAARRKSRLTKQISSALS